MPITEFLTANGFYPPTLEGYSHQIPPQIETLIKLTQKPNIRVMEIGFNAGHSAECFLKNNSMLQLTSFDLGAHEYVQVAKEYMDMVYPNRHTLVLGDSTVTLPEFIEKNSTTKFDVIFIDGGHEYDVARADLENCMRLAHKDTIVIMDDTMHTDNWVAPYNVGPTNAWLEYIEEGKLTELGREDYIPGRGMSWGQYHV